MSRLAGSSRLLRAMNESAALAHLLDRGSLTRNDLRALTGLSKPTVSEALRRLADAGLATVIGHVSAGPGPNAEVYAANPDAAYAVAVAVREPADHSRPSLVAALCDLSGAVRTRIERDVDFKSADAAEAIAAAVADVSDALAGSARAGRDGAGLGAAVPLSAGRIRHVQLGVAGAYDPRTGVIHHVDVPGFDRPGLVADIEARLGTTIDVDNDANLAAVAERRHGAATGVDSFALLWLGEGLGLAIDLGGSLLRGARGGAGEIGYMPLGGDPKMDLQDLVGGEAVVALARRYGHAGDTAEEVVDVAVRAGHEQFLTKLAGRIAVALAAVIAVLDPALVVLAGPVGRAGGAPLRDAVTGAMHAIAPLETTVEHSTVADDPVLLGGLDAGLAAVREALIHSLAGRG